MADDDDRKDDEEQEERSEDDESKDDDSNDESKDDESASPSISAKEMTQAAIEALRDLTGYEPEAATGLQWDGDAWLVTVDVCELRRVPNTTDLIATYVVQLDGDGNLSGYKRTRRILRGQSEES